MKEIPSSSKFACEICGFVYKTEAKCKAGEAIPVTGHEGIEIGDYVKRDKNKHGVEGYPIVGIVTAIHIEECGINTIKHGKNTKTTA